MPREFTPAMSEISGFGGTYELGCRTMVLAGCGWFEANTDADPKFHSYENIVGIMVEDNDDAKALGKAVLDAANSAHPNGGVTGAMYEACIKHILAIRKFGWEEYVRIMSEPDEEEAAS